MQTFSEQENSSYNPWMLVSIILITAIVVGSIIFLWQNSKLNSSEQAFQEKISTLQNQIDTLVAEQAKQKMVNDQPKIELSANQELVYTNTKYGFTLQFPETWKGYTVKSSIFESEYFGKYESTLFGFPVDDALFIISAFGKEQWAKMKAEEGPTPTYLGENNQYIFGYTSAQDAANDTMIARMQELGPIIKTFKLVK